LALDFLKAGLLDRAEAALRKLEGTPLQTQAHLSLLAIFERSRDWPHAAEIAAQLETAGHGSFSGRKSHYLCEQAASLRASGQTQDARTLLQQAVATAPESARAYIELSRLLQQIGEAPAAFSTLTTLCTRAPHAISLMAVDLAKLAIATQQEAQAQHLLNDAYAKFASLDVLDALVLLKTQDEGQATAQDCYVRHLEREPSLVAASKWLAGEKLEHEQFHPLVQRAVDHAVKPLTRYRCAACGFEAQLHFWQCPGCQTWDSFPPRRIEEL
jgi:lipopolysaccharide biosynthesis regulator YciM